MLLCSELILFKTQHGELISRILESTSQITSGSTTSTSSSSPGLEAYLAKCLIDTIEKNGHEMLLDNYTLVAILLDLYIKCETFRLLLNEHAPKFHQLLVTCLKKSFSLDVEVNQADNRHTLNDKSGDPADDNDGDDDDADGVTDTADSCCLNEQEKDACIDDLSGPKSQYIEILLDLIFCYLYYNRRVSLYLFFHQLMF